MHVFCSYILLQIQIARAIMVDVNSSIRVALAPITPPTATQNTNRVIIGWPMHTYPLHSYVASF